MSAETGRAATRSPRSSRSPQKHGDDDSDEDLHFSFMSSGDEDVAPPAAAHIEMGLMNKPHGSPRTPLGTSQLGTQDNTGAKVLDSASRVTRATPTEIEDAVGAPIPEDINPTEIKDAVDAPIPEDISPERIAVMDQDRVANAVRKGRLVFKQSILLRQVRRTMMNRRLYSDLPTAFLLLIIFHLFLLMPTDTSAHLRLNTLASGLLSPLVVGSNTLAGAKVLHTLKGGVLPLVFKPKSYYEHLKIAPAGEVARGLFIMGGLRIQKKYGKTPGCPRLESTKKFVDMITADKAKSGCSHADAVPSQVTVKTKELLRDQNTIWIDGRSTLEEATAAVDHLIGEGWLHQQERAKHHKDTTNLREIKVHLLLLSTTCEAITKAHVDFHVDEATSYLTPPRVKAKSHLMPGGLGSSSDLSFGLFIAYVVLSVFSVLRHPILCIMRKSCIRAFWGMIDAAIITSTAHVLLVIMLGGIRISQIETDKMVGSVNYSKFDVHTYLPPHNGVPQNTVHHDVEGIYEEIESIFATDALYKIFTVIGALMLCFRVASSMAPSVRLSIVTRTLAESVYGMVFLLPLFLALFFGIVLAGQGMFGEHLPHMETSGESANQALDMMTGNGDGLNSFLPLSVTAGLTYYISFFFFLTLLFLNFIMAIIFDAYAEVKTEYQEQGELARSPMENLVGDATMIWCQCVPKMRAKKQRVDRLHHALEQRQRKARRAHRSSSGYSAEERLDPQLTFDEFRKLLAPAEPSDEELDSLVFRLRLALVSPAPERDAPDSSSRASAVMAANRLWQKGSNVSGSEVEAEEKPVEMRV